MPARSSRMAQAAAPRRQREDRRLEMLPAGGTTRSLQSVSEQELHRAVEANVRQGGKPLGCLFKLRRPEAHKAEVGVMAAAGGQSAKGMGACVRTMPPASAGKSPGNTATSLRPSNVSPPASSSGGRQADDRRQSAALPAHVALAGRAHRGECDDVDLGAFEAGLRDRAPRPSAARIASSRSCAEWCR